MSVQHFHSMCNRHMGRPVEIRTRDGRFHRGIIRHVSPSKVYLDPIGPRRGGFGYGFGGFGYGLWGFGWGIALGFIAGVSLLLWW